MECNENDTVSGTPRALVLEVPGEWRQLTTDHLNGGLAGGEMEVLQTITAVSPAPD